MISEAYSDLGGLGTYVTMPTRRAVTTERPVTATGTPHAHEFDALSGYCSCGRRDDGSAAEGSTAWAADREIRAALARVELKLDALTKEKTP